LLHFGIIAAMNSIGHEMEKVPAEVDFRTIATNAINSGLFELDQDTAVANKNILREYSRFPVTLLDSSYGNGPYVIGHHGEDIPEEVVFAVRRNFKKANKLIMPRDQVLLYFHHQFASGDIYKSQILDSVVDDYSAPYVIEADARQYKDESVSFRLEGTKRNSFNRNLYTRTEIVDSLVFAKDHPEFVLAILAYSAVIKNYLQELRGELISVSKGLGKELSIKDIKDYDGYCETWSSSNFTNELIPILNILHKQRQTGNPEDVRIIVDQSMFNEAVKFIINNGAFRNWVNIPEDIALDGRGRTNHFICPGLEPIREQILDGSLLHKIYLLTKKKADVRDETFMNYIKDIRTSLLKRIEQSKDTRTTKEKMQEYLHQIRNITVFYQGAENQIRLEDDVMDMFTGKKHEGDREIEPLVGDVIYSVARKAIEMSLQDNLPVFFSFNGKGYRMTPEVAEDLLLGQVSGVVIG
jgi:hypothetical protein